MLSKKMTFSLMSLITLLAFAFAVTPAMADPKAEHPTGLQHGGLVKGHAHFSTTLSYDEAENVDGRKSMLRSSSARWYLLRQFKL